VWGMVNAITEEARDNNDIEESIKLEKLAGVLIRNIKENSGKHENYHINNQLNYNIGLDSIKRPKRRNEAEKRRERAEHMKLISELEWSHDSRKINVNFS